MWVDKEMKMSDVFNLPVKAVESFFGDENIIDVFNECISDGYYDNFEKAAAHAINNHDRLVEENRRLTELVEENRRLTELVARKASRADELIELLQDADGFISSYLSIAKGETECSLDEIDLDYVESLLSKIKQELE